jgi:hypothetical protein
MARESDRLLAAGATLADQVFWRGVALIAIFFGLLLGYRIVVTRWIRPPSRPPRNPELPRPPTTWESRYGSPT